MGGASRVSNGWEPLWPAGCYDTFGPELSSGARLLAKSKQPFALAKWTHSGTQIVDWTPAGSEAVTRNVYPQFLEFVHSSMRELTERIVEAMLRQR